MRRSVFAGLSVVAACVLAPGHARAQDSANDPWEAANRRLFAAHEAIDEALIEPAARGYRAITTEPVRNGVTNFLRNLRAPVIFANDVLQGEGARAGVTAARFGVNSTIGLLGVMDPAQRMGLERHDEDFGQTLAVWGVGGGPYIFVPVLGPTNLRDGAGRIADMALNPLTWAEFDGQAAVRTTRGLMTGVSARENLIEPIDEVRANSLDPYVTFRSTYGLLRESAIQNNRHDVQQLPEFEAIPNSVDETPDAAPEAPAPVGDAPAEKPVPTPATSGASDAAPGIAAF